MPLSRRAVNAISVALLLFLSMAAGASAQSVAEPKKQADKEDASEQHATEQLRTIAELIRKCSDRRPAPNESDVRVSAPLNVIWDIEQSQSTRSQKMGYVEFVQIFSDVHVPAPLEQCKKRDSACRYRNEATKMAELDIAAATPLPSQSRIRYEFDLGVRGLEFVRALHKRETDDSTHWLATGLDDCNGDAVVAIVNDPLKVTSRPLEIPETLWEAANKGDAKTIRSIGTMYDYGQGLPQNHGEAIRWYRVAANKGDDWSMSRIGYMYNLGLGVSKNDAEALRWRRMAADKGNSIAMGIVGGTYYDGIEVPQNYEEAYFWLSLSASVSMSGFVSSRDPQKALEELRKSRDEVATKLLPAKLAEVGERAQKWIETHPKVH